MDEKLSKLTVKMSKLLAFIRGEGVKYSPVVKPITPLAKFREKVEDIKKHPEKYRSSPGKRIKFSRNILAKPADIKYIKELDKNFYGKTLPKLPENRKKPKADLKIQIAEFLANKAGPKAKLPVAVKA